jgi:site-specific recombinase XerD
MTEEQLFVQFEAYLLTEKRVTLNTFQAYKSDMKQFAFYLKENELLLTTITVKQITMFISYLYDKKIGARSIGRKISFLKLFFRYLNRYHELCDLGIELLIPKIEKKLPRYLSETEVEILLSTSSQNATPQGIRNSVMLYLLYASGMRISELVALKLSDLHFDTGYILVQGKGGKQRSVPITDIITDKLKQYMTTIHNQLIKQSHKEQVVEHLFPVVYGKKIKPISRQAFWIILKKICIHAGITRSISPHQLRHSLATHLLKNGANLRSLQMLLGHEHIATVAIYTHVETSHLRCVYDKKHPRS